MPFMKSEGKRIHFFSIFIDFLNTLRSLILPLGIGFFLGFRHFFDDYGFLLLIPLFILISDFVGWLRTRYEITDEHFHLRSGVFVRKDRYIKVSRIQTIQVSTNILMRPFGLVKVKFDTADADKSDVVLSVVKDEEARRIKQLLGHGDEQLEDLENASAPDSLIRPAGKKSPNRVFKLSGKDLLIAALTSSNIGVIIGTAGAFLSQADDIIPDHFFNSSVGYLAHLTFIFIILLIVLAALILWLASLAVTFIRWGGFTLSVTDETWRIQKGLIQITDETYKLDRVQAIRIKEHWLQQLFGLCTVFAEAIGSVSEDKESGGSILVFPIVRKKALPSFLEAAIPRFAGTIETKRIPMRGVIYALLKPTLLLSAICTGLTWFFSWGKFTWIGVPVIILYFFFSFRTSGFSLKGHRIVFTDRMLAKTTVITLKKHIQTFTKEASRVQRRLGLGCSRFSIRSSSPQTYENNQMDQKDAEKLFQWFRN
ncbi:hypothetical protein EWH99_10170 [Sporolactobacillus sp. THM7-7]|nr:hypothetical protein EWH99_10170 [Sporolactobacillus sp. THM7-7]